MEQKWGRGKERGRIKRRWEKTRTLKSTDVQRSSLNQSLFSLSFFHPLGAFVGVNMVIDILSLGMCGRVVLLLAGLGSVQVLNSLLLKLLQVLGWRLPVSLDIRFALGRIVVVPARCRLE